jgi:hypothetical protein
MLRKWGIALLLVLVASAGAAVLLSRDSGDGRPRVRPPTETPSSGVDRDIGLGFSVCDVQRLSRIDFLGDGTDGTAWTATTVTDGGRCEKKEENSYLVAVDVTGDSERTPRGSPQILPFLRALRCDGLRRRWGRRARGARGWWKRRRIRGVCSREDARRFLSSSVP